MALSALAAFASPATVAAPRVASVAVRSPLPSDRLHFGLASAPGSQLSWMVNSGVPWRYRYQYLAGGINTGGGSTDPNCGANVGWQTWNSPAGQFASNYFSDSSAHSIIPVLTYYEIVQSNPSPGNESALLTKITTVCTMQRYWADFTVLMQKAGAFGGQVVIHVEPDMWGFMEGQSADPSTLSAVVASSGNADLAGLPNTVQGMGWAYLKLRDKYAPNALLAIHVNNWSSGIDMSTDQSTTVNAATQADKVAAFINKAGIVGNPTGVTPWDAVFNDVADHDAAWYGAASGNHWWDRNNVTFPNFSRWLAFVSRLHTDTGRPVVVWQVPVGNQYFKTMNNTPGHYQDNRAEYFLSHPADLANAGIVAVLFGKANVDQTNYDDTLGDGITNPASVVSYQCNLCNSHTSTVSDDDGGYLRMAVGAYYQAAAGCTSATLTAAPPTSQIAGLTVALTASSSGCDSPQYRFWIRPPTGSWTMVRDYNSGNTFTWTTPALSGSYFIGVHVRGGTSSAAYEATASIPYALTATTCGSVSLAATPPSPSAAGTQIALTAVAATCPNAQYEFWMLAAGTSTWRIVRGYSGSNTYNWNSTGALAGTEQFGVWARDAGSSAAYDAYTGIPYTVSTASCSGITATATPPSPIAHGTGAHVVVTAVGTGCTNSPLYEFWMLPAGSSTWIMIRGYSTSPTYDWNTRGALAGTERFGVWIRDSGSSAAYDTFTGLDYTLT